jgi:methionyl-tRNA formyltransferase
LSKNIVILGHGAGVRFVVKSLINNPKLGFKVRAVVTHPLIEHYSDLKMIESRKEMYCEYGYNIFEIKNDFNVDILESSDVNSDETIKWIKKYQPEYIISIGCRNIIKSEFLNSFNRRVLNIHTTPLPKYRGGASDSWMILNGEWGNKLFGCLHYIDEGIDTGDIVAKSYYTVPYKCYPIELFKTRLNTFNELLVIGLNNLLNENFIPEKQDVNEATVFPRLNSNVDGRIDFINQNGEEIEKFIFAFSYPHEGAFCYFNDKIINIQEAEFIHCKSFHPICKGMIFGKDSESRYKVYVQGGYLLIKKVCLNSVVIEQRKIFRLGKFLK